MPKKQPRPAKSQEIDVMAVHMSATTLAFQALVLCLQNKGVLEPGEFPEMLRVFIEGMKDRHPDVTLTLLDDIRRSLLY